MSPRFASTRIMSSAERAYAQTSSKDFIPCEPSASKNAICGLTPTT